MRHAAIRLAGTFLLTGLLTVLAIHDASAHRVNLFAYVDGDRIVTESWFSKSSRVRGGLIEVFDAASGEKLGSGTTDDQGNFSFDIPQAARDRKADLRITLKAGEGHANETVVKASEYLGIPVAPGPASTADPAPGVPAAAPPDPALLAAMDKMLDAKLAPVKSMLAESLDPAPSTTEIIGGIGWIFGLVGLAAYFKSRKG